MAKALASLADEVRPVSFKFGPIGVGWEFVEGDSQVAARLLTFLEDRGVLYNPHAKKCPGGVLESIEQIRDRVQHDMEGLSRKSFLFAVLDNLRRHVNQFRQYACRACDDESRRRCRDCTIYERGCTDALDGLRAAIGFEIAQFTGRYGLTVNHPLATILPRRK